MKGQKEGIYLTEMETKEEYEAKGRRILFCNSCKCNEAIHK
jgi:hypothetical protein